MVDITAPVEHLFTENGECLCTACQQALTAIEEPSLPAEDALINTNPVVSGTALASLNTAAKFTTKDSAGTTTVTYTYDALVGHFNTSSFTSYRLFSDAQENLIDNAWDAFENVANIRFTEVEGGTTANTQIIVRQGIPLISGVAASAYYAFDNKSDIQISTIYATESYLQTGNFGSHAMIHEIGHAMGLSHPFGSGYNADFTVDGSVMSYNYGTYAGRGSGTAPQGLQIYDIAVLQSKYGANINYHSGNDTYNLTSNGTKYTLWDAGGNDTIDSTTYNSNVVLDLRSSERSVTQVGTTNYWIAFGATIENARSGDGADVLYGNDYANNLKGEGGNDKLFGFEGNDSLFGGIGNDYLGGGSGADSLAGGDGSDTITGNSGNDTLTGGIGADIFLVTADNGQDVVTDFSVAEGDKINFSRISSITSASSLSLTQVGSDTSVTFIGQSILLKNITLASITSSFWSNFAEKTPFTTLLEESWQFSASPLADNLQGTDVADIISGDSGNDTILGGRGNDSLYGGNDGDSLNGSFGNDSLLGENGNDTVLGGAGSDSLFGGNDNDYLDGSTENDTLEGGLGNDTLYGGSANDSLAGGSGNDFLFGDDGVDYLSGYLGNDSLNGGNGDDVLFDGIGNDTLTGGEGIDMFKIEPNADDSDVITDFNVLNEKILLSKFTALHSIQDVNPTQQGSDTLLSLENGQTLLLKNVSASSLTVANFDVLSNVPTLYGTSGADNIIGSNQNQIIYGLEGNDILTGDIGKDTIYSGAGDDTLRGGSGNDSLIGEDGNDYLSGWDGIDILNGGAGDDRLRGGVGADILTGGAGKDAFQLFELADSNNIAWDVIQDFTQGLDKIRLTGQGLSFGDLTINHASGETFVTAASGFKVELVGDITIVEGDFGF